MTHLTEDSSTIGVDFEDALRDRYLSYALSTIMSRSLPDVRDGLKPVHRRLIYAMHQLHLDPNSSFKKSARVVGDVMGKFHPHGDGAIYGALVRLAQDFSVRYPLIDGQGNFGNIDGDNPAAMRYTEARLTALSMELLKGLKEDAIDFKLTYDGEASEPLLLPAMFPNLLANGSTGIAVGMATNIPSHNLEELCLALIYLIDKPESTIKDLMRFVVGPDFPTGGILVESEEDRLKAYETGKGTFRLRARFEKEEIKGGIYQIVVTEIPYQIEKAKLIEKIADLILQKKCPLLEDVLDESTDTVRIVLKPKSRNVDPLLLMESLYRQTDLETRIHLNMNVLDSRGVPRVMSLKEVFVEFIQHRLVLLKRSTLYRLEEIKNRLEILDGYLIAYLNLDDIIRIIRFEDDAKVVLIERFALTEPQAEAILNIRLRALQKLQEEDINKEHGQLTKEQEDLRELLNSDTQQKKELKNSFKKLIKLHGKEKEQGKRRTTFGILPQIIEEEQTVEAEDVIVVCSAKNWIRLVKTATNLQYKDGDEERFLISAQTTDRLIICASNGRFYTILVDKIPKSRGQGEPIQEWIDLSGKDEVLCIEILSSKNEEKAPPFLLVGSDGRGFLVKREDVIASTRNGKQVFVTTDTTSLFCCKPAKKDTIAMIGENRKIVAFPVEEIPVLSKGKGVILQRYQSGGVSDVLLFNKQEGFTWNRFGKQVTEKDIIKFGGKRGGAGKLAPTGFPRTNKF